jgi:hypothetical protein
VRVGLLALYEDMYAFGTGVARGCQCCPEFRATTAPMHAVTIENWQSNSFVETTSLVNGPPETNGFRRKAEVPSVLTSRSTRLFVLLLVPFPLLSLSFLFVIGRVPRSHRRSRSSQLILACWHFYNVVVVHNAKLRMRVQDY